MAHTVREALSFCGLNNAQATRFANEVFGDDFHLVRDKTTDELKEDLKSYSTLTVAQGQIRIHPGRKKNIRAMMHWTRDQFRRGLNPLNTAFPVANATNLLCQAETHFKFVKKSKTLMETAKPRRLTPSGMIGGRCSLTF